MSANIAQLLVRSAHAYPALPALARGGRVICSYAELAARVSRLAAGLALRLSANDRVALVMKNCPQYVELLFACWHAGLCAVPVNAKLHPKELEFILHNSGARLCFATADLYDAVAPLRASVDCLEEVIDVDSPRYAALCTGTPMPIAAREAGDPAWLFYTSGTTGRPKGVTLTQKNVMAAILSYFSDVDAIAPGDAIIHAAPMSHGSGFYILPHVAHAGLNVVPESGGFDPAEIYALVQAHRGVTMFAAPTMVKRLVDYPGDADTRNLKTIAYGGGPMYVADCKAAMARFGYKLAQIYGQGESPMTITAMGKAIHADTAYPRYEQRLASVGQAFTGVEVMVGENHDRPLPAGEIGEILVRGDPVMLGYWDNPQASAETLRGGWLHTGDMGCLDEEGFLTLKDRSKDMIISGGSNIYPREVEEVLLRHPAVSEVSVVGKSDPEWGEVVIAFIVARGKQPDAAELDALCLDNIARFKRPKAYRYVEALPKNSTGKVLKTELRKLLS
ncbi:MAG: AMP-dependent synthetase [Betaproteobacteria bacterium RIFCSPLOWO2_02_FULL_65_24]|nr:MAG: AMP-dependent synthetase [Betaproteobacteria bacterium RIFCSPLOWO2_02_FULL_65_24]OGA31186.1 MAG: AMP-dependent synthetase [Betaproteobacteria bacterium RIFCSPLOWO2_12_FULL_62_13b]